MSWRALALILAVSVCDAAPRCSDPRWRHAKTCCETISGHVVLQQKPLTFAAVRVYSSLGKIAWIGTTDANGRFRTSKLSPGKYRLEVDGWGSTVVQLNPELDKGFGGGVHSWSLLLIDNACVIGKIDFG